MTRVPRVALGYHSVWYPPFFFFFCLSSSTNSIWYALHVPHLDICAHAHRTRHRCPAFSFFHIMRSRSIANSISVLYSIISGFVRSCRCSATTTGDGQFCCCCCCCCWAHWLKINGFYCIKACNSWCNIQSAALDFVSLLFSAAALQIANHDEAHELSNGDACTLYRQCFDWLQNVLARTNICFVFTAQHSTAHTQHISHKHSACLMARPNYDTKLYHSTAIDHRLIRDAW